jgi:methyl-accepting chemotaxis protein
MADATVTFAAKDLNLGDTISKLQREVGMLDKKTQQTSKGFDLSFGKIGLAAGVAGAAVKAGMMAVEGATAAARAVVDGFGKAIDLGGKLTDLSSRTGETAGNLMVLQRAFENSDVGADKVGSTINKLQKFMAEAAAGGEEQSATMQALGISMEDLAGKTPTEQLQVFAQKIAGISDPAQRARAAMEVFGKSGGELLPLLNNFASEIQTATGQLGSMPGVMDRTAKALDDLGDNYKAIQAKTAEFAAGFLEDALPALNAFVASLSGVDAASFGESLMKQVMSVADFLIGAFQAPMPAIEAIGQGLLAGVKIAGNNYLNSLIDAGRFAKAFFSSDLPGVISGVLGNTLLKVFVDGAKALIDALRGVITAFETWLGSAISNVVDFFSSKFNGVLTAVAQDFQAAMTDPIGFVTGKLDSALAAVMANGGDTFKTSFDKAGGSALDKISAGLGAASEEYGNKIVDGSIRAKDEFDKLVGTLGKSDQDFFGAKETSAKAAEKFNEVKEAGTKLREEFEKSATSADAAKDNTKNAAAEAEAIAGSFNKAEGSTKKIKEELSESAKLMKSITDAEGKDAVDKGGKLGKRAQDQIARGDFEGARRTASMIAENEAQAALTGVGKNRDRRSVADIGRDYGLSQGLGESNSGFRDRIRNARENGVFEDFSKLPKEKKSSLEDFKSKGSLKDEIAARKSAPVDQPGRDGQPAPTRGKETGGKKGLEDIVEKILDLVKKIEPKLPVAALTA